MIHLKENSFYEFKVLYNDQALSIGLYPYIEFIKKKRKRENHI